MVAIGTNGKNLHLSDKIMLVSLLLKFTSPIYIKRYKGLGSRRGEIGPAIEMHTDLKYVYMVYFIEKNRNFICLVLKL